MLIEPGNIPSQPWKYLEDENALLKAVFSGSVEGTGQEGVRSPRIKWIKVTLRPVMIKEEKLVQFSFYDERKCTVKNYGGRDYAREVRKILGMAFKNIYIETTQGNFQMQTSKKGKVLVNEDKRIKAPAVSLEHNLSKKYLMPDHVPSAFLEAVGIMTKEGKVKADKQNKFRQLNGFLKIVDETFTKARKSLDLGSELLAVDFGCGNAYLTFATYNYFNFIVEKPLALIGVDSNKDLLQAHREEIAKLEWQKLRFQAAKIIDFKPPRRPDLILSLHACDTATDDALFQGIRWGTPMIFSSPCCHHNVQVQMEKHKDALQVYAPLLRHGALSERLGDLLTDSFRALILRIMGYQTDVIEFVSAENTNRNLLIRAVKYLEPGDRKFVEEYKILKKTWHVTPHLEKLLGESFQRYLED